MYLCFVCIKSALGYFLRSVSSYHFKTSHSDTSSYANFRVRSWDTVILGELWWWMLGEEWPWQCVMLLYKQTDKTRVNKRTAGWGWGLHIPTHIHSITMLPKLHCHGNTILLGRSGLITILMSQNALFSLGQLRAVWKFQSHCSIPQKSSTRRHFNWVMQLNVTLLSASSVCCVCGCQLWYHHRYFWDRTVETIERKS